MKDSQTKTAAFSDGYNARMLQLIDKQIEVEEMEKAAAGAARLAGKAVGGAGRAMRGIGNYFTKEGPLIPGAPGRFMKGIGEEFNLGRQGLQRGSAGHLESMGLGPSPGMAGGGMSNMELHQMGLLAPSQGMSFAPGWRAPFQAARLAAQGGEGASTMGAASRGAGAGAAGAAGRGLRAPSGFQRTLSRTLGPDLAHYPMMAMQYAGQHPGMVGVGAGAVGMHQLHNYEDGKRRDAVANMSAMDRLQAALGLVFNPQATANRLY
jgi:hypothetical protein